MTSAILDRVDENAPLLAAPVSLPSSSLLVPEGQHHNNDGQNRLHSDSEDQNDGQNDDVRGGGGYKANMAVVFPAIASGIFLAAADGTIVLVNYATISSELNALNKAQWIVTTYTLVSACFQPLYGKLCDIFGRKNCILAAYIVFGLGCVACGMSTTIEGLIAARVLQAVGGSGLGTVVSILLTDLVPPEDRGVWQGMLNIMYLFGAGIGGPVGGFLAGSVGWRWSFIGQVPLCVIAAFVISWTLEDDSTLKHDNRGAGSSNGGSSSPPLVDDEPTSSSLLPAKLRRIDFLGSGALVATIACFLFAMDRGGNVSWAAPECYIPLVVSLFSGSLFFYIETRVALEPVMPPSVIFNRALLPVYMQSSLAFFAIIALEFTLPLYYQARAGMSPQKASLFMVPAIVAGTSTALVTGFWMRRSGGRYYRALLFACACQTAGAVVVYLFSGSLRNDPAALVVGHVVSELGVGNFVVSGLLAVISLGGDASSSSSSALRIAAYYSLRNMGSVLGVTAVSTVIQQGLRDLLTAELSTSLPENRDLDVDAIVDEVRHSLENLRHLDPRIANIVRSCYGQAINRGFLLVLFAAAMAIVPALYVQGGRGKAEKEEQEGEQGSGSA